MIAPSLAAVVVAGLAWDGWRRWLAHRAAGYEQQIANIDTRCDVLAESVDELLAKHKRLHDQVQGIALRKVTGR
jgi:hypothetical protein